MDRKYIKFLAKMEAVDKEVARITSIVLPPSKINPILEQYGTTPVSTGLRMSDAIKRPELNYEKLAPVDEARPELPFEVWEEAEIRMKYEGYILRQKQQVEQFNKMENKLLPEECDYMQIHGLRLEARQKLSKIRPKSLGQASRISGVSPSDISVLIVWLESRG